MHHYKDKEGKIFGLTESVWDHITAGHPEIKEQIEIELILSEPEFIVQSNWESTSRRYYKKIGRYFRVVVVDFDQCVVKTMYTTHKIKSGKILWQKS